MQKRLTKEQDAKPIGEVMDAQSSLINLDEPYIITPEEEVEIIAHHVNRVKEHAEYLLQREVGIKTKQEIEWKLSQIDFKSQIDYATVLKFANSCKHQKLWQEEQKKKQEEELASKRKELRDTWSAKRIYSLMKLVSKEIFDRVLVMDDDNLHLIKTICFFLSEDPRFESELGYSFKKGLLIRGVSGLGKTFLFQCAASNGLNPVLIINMLEIAEEIRANGEFTIPMKHEKVLYLDDVGTEEHTVNHYGTKINFFKNFIELTYQRNEHRGFGKLVVSTNNNFDQLEEKYGFRVRSRMKDMFNIVDVKGYDRRGRP